MTDNKIDFQPRVEDNLQNFLFKYGIDTTTNFDLKNIAKDLDLNIKVLMKDELNQIKPNKLVILNLESSKENDGLETSDGRSPADQRSSPSNKVRGSHWVCLFKNKYYFDPYGILPMKNITCEMWNTLQIQPDNTKMCGQLCLYILYRLDHGDSFENLILTVYEEMNDLID